MVVRFGIQRAALAALNDHAMRIMMSHVHQKRRLATATAIGLVPATFAHRRARRMLQNVMAGGLFGVIRIMLNCGMGTSLFAH